MEHSFEAVGIDIGIRRPLTCSNGLKIEEFDLTREEKNVKYYQREMSKKTTWKQTILYSSKKILESIEQENQQEKRPISQNHTPHS